MSVQNAKDIKTVIPGARACKNRQPIPNLKITLAPIEVVFHVLIPIFVWNANFAILNTLYFISHTSKLLVGNAEFRKTPFRLQQRCDIIPEFYVACFVY